MPEFGRKKGMNIEREGSSSDADVTEFSNLANVRGDLLYTNSTPAWARLAIGTTGKVLTSDGTDVSWANETGWINVKDHGALGDGSTDDGAAILAAITASAEGQVIYFPPGVYMTTVPIVVTVGRKLIGYHTSGWLSDSSEKTVIKAKTGFTNTRGIVEFNNVRSASIEGLMIDGGAIGTAVDGVKVLGGAADCRIYNVQTDACTGNGINITGTSGDTKEVVVSHCRARDNTGYGISTTGAADLVFTETQCNSNDTGGWYISGTGNTSLIGCRAEWNLGAGLLVNDTTAATDRLRIHDFSTDRNDTYGIYISDNSGSSFPILITDAYLARDGRNGGTGGTPYAGLRIGDGTNSGGRVVCKGLVVVVARDDGGAGVYSPHFAVNVHHTTYTYIDGMLWGQDAAVINNAGVGSVRFGVGTVLISGDTGGTTDIPIAYRIDGIEDPRLEINGTTGLRIGTATTQKLAFFNDAPVVQPTALTAVDATAIDSTYGATEEAVVNNIRTRVGELETKLTALGLLA